MAYNNLRFFDSDSNDLNLVFNTDLDLWQGVAYLPLVSTGLYETLTLHILENVEGQLFEDLHVTPIAEAVGTVSFKFRFSNDYNTSEDIFLYSAKSNAGEILVQKDLEQTAALLDNSIEVDYNTVTDKKIVTANLKANPIMVRAALNSEVEGFHVRPLSIIEVVNGVETREIARIKVYGEVEGEDERLRTLLTNIGMNLDDLDYFIFKDSNINEQSPDHILLNQKRKELLLQASQIKPFIGTYKALLNAVDFFGYDKVTLKEYWLNINEQSENFGKLKAVAVPNQDVIGFLADKNKTTDLPNSNQKKTSRFSLVYRLNTPTGKQDEWDMPIVEETLDYSPDEVLIKLYGLKNKLQKEYLPLQAKIVDITGEGDYFSQFNQNVWNNQHNIKAQEAGREYTVEKVPALRDVFMEDLRLVDYRLTGFNQDFEAIPAIDKLEICDSIETFYTEYYDSKLDTFNTIDGIPIGAPISLHIEEGLEDSWDFADFTWEDAGDEYSGKGVYNFFADYPVDVPVYGPNPAYPGIVPGTEGNTYPTPEPVNILVSYFSQYTNFKTLEDNGNKLLNWEDWWHRGIYEIEWKLIGPNGYNRSFRGPVYEYNHFPLTLPYVGSYTVEAHAHDLYNVTSTRIQKDWIEVKNKNVELYGLTQLAPKKLDWQEYVYSWDKSGSSWDWSRENTLPVSDTISTYYLTMDRANYIQDPEENGLEFSTVRRYQDTTQPNGFNETSGPYQWSALDNHVWNDGPEVTWKMTRIGSDINSSFQIWALPNNQWINITQKDPGTGVISRDSYQIVTTIPNNTIGFASQWQLIADELNSLDSNEHPILSKFNFNPIFEDITPFDIDGDSTPFPNTEDQLLYILSVAKEPARTYDFKSAWMSNIENSSPGSGTIREQLNFVSYNPGFDDTYIINGLVDLHKLNHVTFSYDLTNMPGIVSQNWKVTNNTLNIDDIYYSNQVLTHLFKDKGYYTVELEIQDSNGNKNTITKNILNII